MASHQPFQNQQREREQTCIELLVIRLLFVTVLLKVLIAVVIDVYLIANSFALVVNRIQWLFVNCVNCFFVFMPIHSVSHVIRVHLNAGALASFTARCITLRFMSIAAVVVDPTTLPIAICNWRTTHCVW